MSISNVEKWSEILDDYEVSIDKKDYEVCFVLMDRKAETPVYDLVNEQVEFVIVADSKEQLQETVSNVIPTALQSDDTFVLATNWAFVRTKYKALNYNGRRITLNATADGNCPMSAISIFSQTLIPTLGHWFTTIFNTDGDTYGILSRSADNAEYAIVTDEADEMLALLIKGGNDNIAVDTISNPRVTLATMNLTKIFGATNGLYYRGKFYPASEVTDEIGRCLRKFKPEEESTIGLLDLMKTFKKEEEETEDK
jgi:hypothetical protein